MNVIQKTTSLFIALICLLLFGCTDPKSSNNHDGDDASEKLSEGDYCADISYRNPRTGRSATYELSVEIFNNAPRKIYFCNGGYLDHFNAPQLNKNHTSSFTSFEGVQFDVSVSHRRCAPKENCGNDDEAIYDYGYLRSELNITSEELEILEKEFDVTPNDFVTRKEYNSIRDHFDLIRSHNTLKSEIEAGYAEEIYWTGVEDVINCQTAIIKRYGKYYLLKVKGQEECPSGVAKFDPNDVNWQMVLIKEDTSVNEMRGFQMKLIESSSNLEYLKNKAHAMCG
jgi:hypothetical protein